MTRLNASEVGVVALAVSLGGAFACSGSDSEPGVTTSTTSHSTTTGTGGGAGEGGGGGGGSGESLTFVAVKYEEGIPELEPIEGTMVAFDAPGGERRELATGADGRVTFEGIDWSLGTASATATATDRALYSVVGLDPEIIGGSHLIDGAVPLLMFRVSPDDVETVRVSGTVTGLGDTAHHYTVNVVNNWNLSLWSGKWEDGGSSSHTFLVEVPAGVPFVLQAIEMDASFAPIGNGEGRAIYQVLHQGFAATSSDVTDLVLDFADHAMTTHVVDDYRASLPTRAESITHTGKPGQCASSMSTWYCIGWSTYDAVNEETDEMESSMLWVEPEWEEAPLTYYRLFYPDGGKFMSGFSVEGFPQAGLGGTLPDPPEWVVPADPEVPHNLHEPMQWQVFDDDLVDAFLFVRTGSRTLWVARVPPGATTLTLPAAPSALDEAAWTGLTQRAELGAGVIDWTWNYWSRLALTPDIETVQ